MAEAQDTLDVSDLKETFLECPICLEHFDQTERRPRLLVNCLHAFCTQCLEQLLEKEGRGQVTCPNCRHVQNVQGNAQSLPVDPVRNKLVDYVQFKKNKKILCTDCPDGSHAVIRCHECQSYMCTRCNDAHQRNRSTRRHTPQTLEDALSEPIRNFQSHFCKDHPDHKIEFYCGQCSSLCCVSCSIWKHKGHDLVPIEDAANSMLSSLKSQMEDVEKSISVLQRRKSFLGQESSQNDYNLKQTTLAINHTFEKLFGQLEIRQSKLITDLQQGFGKYENGLRKQLEATEDSLAQMESTLDYFKQMESKSDDCEVLSAGPVLVQSLEAAAAVDESQDFEHRTLTFDPEEIDNVISNVQGFGGIHSLTIRSKESIYSELFEGDKMKIRFVIIHCQDRLKMVETDLKDFQVSFAISNEPEYTIRVVSTIQGHPLARRQLQEIVREVKFSKRELERPGMKEFLKSEDVLKQIEEEMRCVIDFVIDDEDDKCQFSQGIRKDKTEKLDKQGYSEKFEGAVSRVSEIEKHLRIPKKPVATLSELPIAPQPENFKRQGTFQGIQVLNNPGKASLLFYTDNELEVSKAVNRIYDSWDRNSIKKQLQDPTIKLWTDEQVCGLTNIGNKHLVSINVVEFQGLIQVYGLKRNVADANIEILDRIRDIEREQRDQEYAEDVQVLHQWYFEEINEDGEPVMVPYQPDVNMKLELSYRHYTMKQFNYMGYVFDFENWVEYPENDLEDALRIIRKENIEAANEKLPSCWEDMTGDRDMEIEPVNSSEFTAIRTNFKNALGNVKALITGSSVRCNDMEQVERIQNKTLYQRYQAKKKQLTRQNPGVEVEKTLWHGISKDEAKSIVKHGFNRSFCHISHNAYGEGVYFTCDAGYVTRSQFAPADDQGKRHMFQCKVLTGSFTEGQPKMRVPPPKDESDRKNLYDSVVDDQTNPIFFVIFSDTQAYPEYLVTFK